MNCFSVVSHTHIYICHLSPNVNGQKSKCLHYTEVNRREVLNIKLFCNASEELNEHIFLQFSTFLVVQNQNNNQINS